ncbi:ATPase/kinase [Candidatus Endolissoclinum faulkneri L5]|uniref:tRNA threonylcarbamoyladenosine biosynthesis protein TsaE n=1 Tax=Candidatus Endolissoclinum faulkneri L5 TaxID=1401328 RepID=V9TTN1_9PROT|nr:tRNA (adenosine(37)-N6)-threonylcarbamoyltransferase complex ATPase subunit type 1 TsaE [Candidatus Endolissoclinum faulkneri]AHC73961.1 ATPase/kinase [Candidatus Endolissoclinum faulkneri L5]
MLKYVLLDNLNATQNLASFLAKRATIGMAILLKGSLGAGKTELSRAFVRAWLNEPNAEVPSPSFTMVQFYESTRGTVCHCDLYYLSNPGQIDGLGLEEAFDESIVLVEWPDQLGMHIPFNRLELTLEVCDSCEWRIANLIPYGTWINHFSDLNKLFLDF